VSAVLQIVVGVLVLAGLGYWLRGFTRPVRRAYRQARDLVGTVRRVRSGFDTARPERADRDPRVVDVTPRQDLGIICPACGDRLNDAQVRALRARNVRCPGSSRVSRPCPYYGERDLN
jgi:hypothetical protein